MFRAAMMFGLLGLLLAVGLIVWQGYAQVLAAFAAAPYIFPDKRIHLQYTTTSPKLHKVLGVESPVFDD